MKAQIVSFHCVVKNNLGQVLSSSFNQDVINQLDEGKRPGGAPKLQGLIAGIQNVRAGEKRRISVPVDEAYGPYNPELLFSVPRSKLLLGDQLKVGSEVELHPGRNGLPRIYRVVQVRGSSLELDGNHPLAGQDLIFEIEVISARDARSEDFGESYPAATGHYVH